MNVPSTSRIVVAGAGPAGLTAAIALARAGIETLVVSRDAPTPHPRATLVSTRSMELLRAWGLAGDVRARGVDVAFRMCSAPTLAEVASGTVVDLGVPSPRLAAALSPETPACVAQDELERVLREHLATLHAATLVEGVEVTGVQDLGDRVRVSLSGGDGAWHAVDAHYVIGADGAHSAVRRAVGIPVREHDSGDAVVSAVVHAPLWELVGEHRYGLYDMTASRSLFVAAGPADRWVFGFAGSEIPSAEAFARRAAQAAGVPDLPVTVTHRGRFRFTAGLAERFRRGRAFLVGDAAHRTTPRGGTGMNSAIHSAYDLAWRLVWVLRGWSDDALLDGYEAERRPVVEHTIARSLDPLGSRRDEAAELHADLGSRIPHAWVGCGERSTLDVLGPGLTLFSGPEARVRVGGTRAPVALRPLGAAAARTLGLLPTGAVLVRPDGVAVDLHAGAADARLAAAA